MGGADEGQTGQLAYKINKKIAKSYSEIIYF
jgi:hypothetical protein